VSTGQYAVESQPFHAEQCEMWETRAMIQFVYQVGCGLVFSFIQSLLQK